MTTHSMRSSKICFPPASHELGSCRGTYSENFSNTARAPGTHSLRTSFIGPLPTYSLMGLNGSVAAMRAGMMKHEGVPTFPSAIGNFE